MRRQDYSLLAVYAEALYQAAEGLGQTNLVFGEAVELRRIFAQTPAILRLMERPGIGKRDKKAFLRRVFEGRLSPLLLTLPQLLIDRNRGGHWDGILEVFIGEAERRRGVLSARVATARPLSPEERRRLTTCLEAFVGKQLRVVFHEDAGLIGGVAFRCDDTLIDTSLRSGLTALRHRLDAAKVL